MKPHPSEDTTEPEDTSAAAEELSRRASGEEAAGATDGGATEGSGAELPQAGEGPSRPSEVPPIDLDAMCAEMFETIDGGLATTRAFDERYRGRSVLWSGTLVKLERIDFHLVFGFEEMTVATVLIDEVTPPLSARHDVHAIVQLAEQSASQLRDRIRKTVTFEGELARCDIVSYSVYVAHGRVIPS